jgi:F-type H+-transporting ATPase subunit epsilon
MKLELVSLTGVKFADDAYEVIIPTADGEIAVFPDHMPLISLAVPGVLTVRRSKTDSDDQLEHFATLGGVIEITGTTLRILVDEVEHADDIYEDEVRKAYEKAKKMKSEAKDAVELEKAQALMDRHAVRLKVTELKRHHQRRR